MTTGNYYQKKRQIGTSITESIGMKIKLSLNLLSTKKGHWWLSIFLWMALLAPAQASVIMRVAIQRNVTQVKVGSSTTAVIKDGSGRSLGELPAMTSYDAQAVPGGIALDKWRSSLFWIEPTGKGFVYIGSRWYRGRTLVVPTDKGLTAVNWVDVEEYLYSVVGGEMFPNWPQEALQAQAIAARTEAIYDRQRSRNNPIYDLDDTPAHAQNYEGVIKEAPSTYTAVDATAGQVLTYNNQIAFSPYHNCSGGHTENVEDVWGSNEPYLRGVQAYDGDAKDSACVWSKSFSPGQISAMFPEIGNVKDMKTQLSPFGSVKVLEIDGDKGTKVLQGEKVFLGLRLNSAHFTITKGADGNYTLNGVGWGHGVGMSQWGAYTLAAANANHLQILGHFYPGVALTKIQAK